MQCGLGNRVERILRVPLLGRAVRGWVPSDLEEDMRTRLVWTRRNVLHTAVLTTTTRLLPVLPQVPATRVPHHRRILLIQDGYLERRRRVL